MRYFVMVVQHGFVDVMWQLRCGVACKLKMNGREKIAIGDKSWNSGNISAACNPVSLGVCSQSQGFPQAGSDAYLRAKWTGTEGRM
jgi:hypothetical protein